MIGGQVPLSDIRPRQFHRDMGNLDDLARHIKQHGQVVPILVDGGYEIIDGERRFAVAQKLGWETISCIATNNYGTIVAQMNGTRKMEELYDLPSLPLPPRAIRETLELFDRLFPRKSPPVRSPNARIAPRMHPTLKADVAGFLGISTDHLRAIRDIYEFEQRTAAWPEYKPFQKQAQDLIDGWEARLRAGETISSFTVRGWLYKLVHSTDPRNDIVKRARSRPVTRQPITPVPVDSPLLARTQMAAFDNTFPILWGAITGLVAQLPVSSHIPIETLRQWEQEYRQLNTAWYQVARNIRERLRNTTPEENTS
jgi:hypothetical protein